MRSLITPMLALLAALLLVTPACGDDETTEQGPADEPTTTDPTTTAAPGGTTGTGTVTIADAAFPFTATTCTFEEEGPVTVEGAGESGDLSYEVTVSRTDDGITRESVRVVFSPQEVSTLTNLYTDDSGSARFEVGEGVLTGTGDFLSAGGAPAGAGSVEVTCGATPG